MEVFSCRISWTRCGLLQKFSQFCLVYKYIFGNIFIKIRSLGLVLREVTTIGRQTERETNAVYYISSLVRVITDNYAFWNILEDCNSFVCRQILYLSLFWEIQCSRSHSRFTVVQSRSKLLRTANRTSKKEAYDYTSSTTGTIHPRLVRDVGPIKWIISYRREKCSCEENRQEGSQDNRSRSCDHRRLHQMLLDVRSFVFSMPVEVPSCWSEAEMMTTTWRWCR